MECEAFRFQLIDKIDAFTRAQGREPAQYTGGPIATPPPEMKRALQQRQDELIREEILKFQTRWIEKQQKKWAKANKSQINSVENCPTLTTR
jgi:hypothetical protein